MSSKGILRVVGTGFGVGHLTQEALSVISDCEKLFHLVQDAVIHRWLERTNPTAESLFDSYREGRPRPDTYEEIAERILAPVREGRYVAAAFYGHPGVFATPAHEAIRRARSEGHTAEMFPGISGDSCLFADLGVDPGSAGCQSFEATDFLLRKRIFDSTSHLLIWQVGAIAVSDFRAGRLWNRPGVGVLARRLSESYPSNHPVIVYEHETLPIFEFARHECALEALVEAPVTLASILYVPPLPRRPDDEAMRRELGMPPSGPPGRG